MEGYTGWSVYDDVTIVLKEKIGEETPQGYIVNPTDKKQLNSAIRWGTTRRCVLVDEKTKQYDYVENAPKVVTVKNEGFTLKLLDSANDSYRGGKLSFWNCLIEKSSDNIKCVVGIDSNLLLILLLQSEFTHGVCCREVQFARCQGGVGVLHEEMKEYTDAISDMKAKKEITRGKTTKWQLGHEYITLKLNETYTGDVYCPFKVDYKYAGAYRHKFILTKVDQTLHNVVPSDYVASYEKMSDYLKKIEKRMKEKEDYIENVKGKTHECYTLLSTLDDYNAPYRLLKKFPARKENGSKIEVDIDVQSKLTELFRHVREKAYKLYKDGIITISPLDLDTLYFSGQKFDWDDLSDTEKAFLQEMISEDAILNYYKQDSMYHREISMCTEVDGKLIDGIHLDKIFNIKGEK